MSRDFEKEYRNMLQEETPMLWDRIEKSLPEKQLRPQFQSENIIKISNSRKRKNRIKRYGAIAGGVAACICVMITGATFFRELMSTSSESATCAIGTYDSVAEADMDTDDMKDATYAEAADNVEMEADAGAYSDSLEKPETDAGQANGLTAKETAEGSEMFAAESAEEMQALETDSSEREGYENVTEVTQKPASVDAKAGILIDASNGQILFEQNADTALPPASTTKLMTALLTVEAIESGELSLDQIITVTNDARNITPVGGSVLALPIEEGEEVSIRDLLYAVLLKSDCVCCNILAEQVSVDVETFVARMNERAVELGCTNTIFLNTHGYKESGHMTTAHDLALMAAEAMQHPIFYEIVNTDEYTIPETNLHEAREIRNTNWLLGTMWDRNVKQYNKDYEYPYAHGVKTGYTAEAGHCLVSYAKKDDRALICVILGAQIDTDEDTGYLVNHMYEDTIKLYNWGFGAYERGEITLDENATLVDASEKTASENVMEQESDVIEETIEDDVEQEVTSESDEELVENNGLAGKVLIAGGIVLLLALAAGIAFLIYRKYYFFD